MGVTLNICKYPPGPIMKAKAEELAVLTQETLALVYTGTAQFDKAGQYYWSAELDNAKKAVNNAFEQLADAKLKLETMLKFEFEMYNEPSSIEGVNEDLFYGFNHLDDMFRTRVRGIEHCIQAIDHLQHVKAETLSLNALNDNDIRGLYKAVSNPSRELVEAALNLHMNTLEHSKTTHETSDLLKTIYDLKPVSNGI